MGHAVDDDVVSRPGFDPARMLFDDLQVRFTSLLFLFDLSDSTSQYTRTLSSSFSTYSAGTGLVGSGLRTFQERVHLEPLQDSRVRRPQR